MPVTRSARRLATAALLASTAAAVLTASTGTSAADATDRGRGDGVAQLRKDLRPYEDVERALADGFVATPACTSSPDGGMGVHYVHPQRLQQAPDPRLPQILLYAQTADGLELLGAEFFAPDLGQPRPSLYGQPFDGPMPGHEPGMPVHYDLHVWTHEANPAGVFAPWNPKVAC